MKLINQIETFDEEKAIIQNEHVLKLSQTPLQWCKTSGII
jgi:hypothetical protein